MNIQAVSERPVNFGIRIPVNTGNVNLVKLGNNLTKDVEKVVDSFSKVPTLDKKLELLENKVDDVYVKHDGHTALKFYETVLASAIKKGEMKLSDVVKKTGFDASKLFKYFE